jgi:hypothetical protein
MFVFISFIYHYLKVEGKMRVKVNLYLLLFLISASLVGCSKESALNNQDDKTTKMEQIIETSKEEENTDSNNTSEPFVGSKELDSDTEQFFYGTWKVEKLLGFADSYNDASEYPAGQNVIGDEIIINKDFFSSKGFKNYNVYQSELKNPNYNLTEICYNKDSFYRIFKMDLPSLAMNDEIKAIRVSDSSDGLAIPVSFFVVNNDRLILVLEATLFELEREAP